jgi:hypothetical protein
MFYDCQSMITYYLKALQPDLGGLLVAAPAKAADREQMPPQGVN